MKMININYELGKINTLEEYALGTTSFHQKKAESKLIVTVLYILCVVSFSPYDLGGLLLFAWYPLAAMLLSGISWQLMGRRLMIPIPFALFAGGSNLFFNTQVVAVVSGFGITYSMISFISILIKTVFTVTAVLVLIGTTPLEKISHGLKNLHMPGIFIAILEMIYRYLSLLMEEAASMYAAYLLRNPGRRALQMKDMGNFLGQLLIRSVERSERIFEAMKLRGYVGVSQTKESVRGINWREVFWAAGYIGAFILGKQLSFFL